MLACVHEAMADITKAIDENHKAGFELVNFGRRLDYLKALVNGENSEDIIEYRDRLNDMRLRRSREDE